MVLTERDRLIIETLKEQDFCFYNDIKNKFFSSDFSASHRLTRLKENGYIFIESLSSADFKKDLDSSSIEIIGKKYKVISLADKNLSLRRNASPWKKTHQLLLFSLRERLKKLLGFSPVFESRVRDSKYTLYDRTFEPFPDFYIQGKNYKLAVELELHLKSKNRYSLKMSEYRKSSYSHVLYVVTNAKKITNLVRAFRYYKYIGITHYEKPEDVVSYWHGNISLSDWLKERTK